MLRGMKLLLKGEVGVCELNSHENYIVDHGKSWRNHGIVFLNFCGNPAPETSIVHRQYNKYHFSFWISVNRYVWETV